MAARSSYSREYELMEIYSCSRMTVNKVLSGLASAGLLERRKRAGTFVAHSHSQTAVMEIRDIKAEILGRGYKYHYDVLSRSVRRATASDVARIDVDRGARLLAIAARHMASGTPFAIEDRLIDLSIVPDAEKADFATIAPGKWLLDKVPWTEAEHLISAINAESAMATLLLVPIGQACLVMDRKTWRGKKAVTGVRFTFPGTQHRFFAQFRPSAGQPSPDELLARSPDSLRGKQVDRRSRRRGPLATTTGTSRR